MTETDEQTFCPINTFRGGGVTVGDINSDVLGDVCFNANRGENKLYLNNGILNFKIDPVNSMKQDAGNEMAESAD